MDELLEEISVLKRKLASANEDARLSASIGKELLEQNTQYKMCIEKLQQDKHSLQLNLDMKVKMIENQTSEIETQKECLDILSNDHQLMKKENSHLNKKLQEKTEEVMELKVAVEELSENNDSCQKKISVLETELESYKNSTQMSNNDTNSEEYMKLTNELHQCQDEKESLTTFMSELKQELEDTKFREKQLTELIEGLEQHLQEKEEELQAYSGIIEKAKEESAELKGEIEFLKLAQVDVNKRGNSVFAEVEDRRQAVEKQLIILKNKYDCVLKNYEKKDGEVRKVKNQLAIVLRMISSKVDCKYIQEIEDRLFEAQKEIKYLTNCLNEQTKLRRDLASTSVMNFMSPAGDAYNYLRTLLHQSQKREEDLGKELENMRKLKVIQGEKLLKTQHKLYHIERQAEGLKGESLALRLKIQELTERKPDGDVTPSPRIERIPGFQEEKELERKSHDKDRENEKENDFPTYDSPSNFAKENKSILTTFKVVNLGMERNKTKKKVSFCPVNDVQKSSDFQPKTRNRQHTRKNVTAPTLNMAVNAENCKQM